MSEFQQGLLIAAIGMGLVFVIIIFLWGLMALMMRVTSREKKEDAAGTTSELSEIKQSTDVPSNVHHRRAVAAAVAVRFALETTKTRQAFTEQVGASNTLSPWQTVHRNRQIE